MRVLAVVVAALLSTSALAADVAPRDPYARPYQELRAEAYRQARTQFLDRVEMLYHAYGCGVFRDEAEFSGLYHTWLYALAQRDVPGLDWPAHDDALQDEILLAAHVGRGRARASCASWLDDPRRVYLLREMAGVIR